MDRKTAAPMVHPIWRKNVLDEVATPRSAWGSAFCMDSVIVCRYRLAPAPSRNITTLGVEQRRARRQPAEHQHAGQQQAAPVTGRIL